ncbi:MULTISPECIES: NCS2 family permease [unclassified Gemella]|uniref:NCS2 family permease n=1 Tax=unclassified Gemella TaxID=2624949 RepID=UPI00107402D3|nr:MULTISPECIES: NCS2 family permease [unclassified Gemella]MBF0709705.1 NCS2 family permease [Gemella sp. GL1.1]MBF0746877.1 NCS2 family permease [Gemella sp. 19428wG2_WT2a]NYS27049.1 NCS2 family permease [Gemella sp. GL1]TFU59107.1 NCS2 family permease [Gemella sp. WT2a]
MLNRFFKLQENKTNVRTELSSGAITFFAMAYILVVNPAVLSSAGIPFDRVFTATIISIVLATLIVAFGANYPIVVAPAMGINSYFASMVGLWGVDYKTILATCLVAGLVFIFLSLTNLREELINAIPNNLRHGISVAIGLFITFIGFKNSGIIVANPATILSLGKLGEPSVYLTILGVVLILALIVLEVKGAIFIGMFITAVISYFMGILKIGEIFEMPNMDFSLLYNPITEISNIFEVGLYGVVFAFLMVTLFDTTGTMMAVTSQAGLVKNNKIPKARFVFLADSIATTVGALLGTSPTSPYIESSSGVANGGRTGLTALTTAVLVFLSLFLAPLAAALSSVPAITSPALIIIGSFMMENVSKIEWDDITESFPAFITILGIPLTGSINDGIAFGFIFYVILKVIKGKAKDIHPLMYIFSLLFLIQLIVMYK